MDPKPPVLAWHDAERVDSKESFLAFVLALSEDRFAADAEQPPEGGAACDWRPRDWANGTIGDFLERMAAWGTATSGMTGQPMVAEAPSWRAFAQLLIAGKEYE